MERLHRAQVLKSLLLSESLQVSAARAPNKLKCLERSASDKFDFVALLRNAERLRYQLLPKILS